MFRPVNRHILIERESARTPEPESLIVLPEDYAPDSAAYVEAYALGVAEDVRINIKKGDKLVVDRSMIEEISIESTIYNVILDNYVVGIVD